ncbi:MAG: ATP-binding cassette domain-containing protein [Chitinophagaceae bacterium]|nr:MAG: ATP-binding cassette domain-containing protein [Chitinophagaceae bacterium]
MSSSDPVISIHNLFKRYGNGDWVLNGIDLTVYPGQVIGYIGPNGAGKSTTVKILTGMIPEFEGDISILGMNLHENLLEVKRQIGYIPENAELYYLKSFPFSEQWSIDQSSGRMMQAFLLMIVTGGIGLLHYFVMDYTPVVIILAVLTLVADCLLINSFGNKTWKQLTS